MYSSVHDCKSVDNAAQLLMQVLTLALRTENGESAARVMFNQPKYEILFALCHVVQQTFVKDKFNNDFVRHNFGSFRQN